MEKYTKIQVNASTSYPIYIGDGLLDDVALLLDGVVSSKKIAIVSDDIVASIYLDKLSSSLNNAGFSVFPFVFPNGEGNKNFSSYLDIINFLAKNNFTRIDGVIALGGGVVGDVVGFASATYLRGIKYIQIPTTLLSATDSSVGGKTGIDIEYGKNLVGAFKQPNAVICDTQIIKKLPKQVFDCGFGEVLKYALLDKEIFDELSKDNYDLTRLIALCIDYKRRVVERDEFEKGDRRLLNLGHTPAHAIEKLSNYTILHGVAVSMGLKIMLNYSLDSGYLDKVQYDKILNLFSNYIDIPTCPFTAKELAESSLNDKKAVGEYINILVVHGIGDVRQEKISVKQLEKVYKC